MILVISLSLLLPLSLKFSIGVLNEPESLVVNTLFELTFFLPWPARANCLKRSHLTLVQLVGDFFPVSSFG